MVDFFNNNTFNLSIEKIISAIKDGEFKKFMEQTNKTELVKKQEDMIYQISTLSKQLDNDEIASIHLGECEEKLKNINGNLNEELTIFKVSYLIPKTNTQIMEYLIFTKEGVQLNLDICKDLQIQYSIPLEINEKIYINMIQIVNFIMKYAFNINQNQILMLHNMIGKMILMKKIWLCVKMIANLKNIINKSKKLYVIVKLKEYLNLYVELIRENY